MMYLQRYVRPWEVSFFKKQKQKQKIQDGYKNEKTLFQEEIVK